MRHQTRLPTPRTDWRKSVAADDPTNFESRFLRASDSGWIGASIDFVGISLRNLTSLKPGIFVIFLVLTSRPWKNFPKSTPATASVRHSQPPIDVELQPIPKIDRAVSNWFDTCKMIPAVSSRSQ